MERLKKQLGLSSNKNFEEDSSQRKGFIFEGIKAVIKEGPNLINVLEVELDYEYYMELHEFLRLVNAAGFSKKSLRLAEIDLYYGNYVLYDFNNKKVLVYEKEPPFNPISSYFIEGLREYER